MRFFRFIRVIREGPEGSYIERVGRGCVLTKVKHGTFGAGPSVDCLPSELKHPHCTLSISLSSLWIACYRR